MPVARNVWQRIRTRVLRLAVAALTAPTSDCGKTTLMLMLEALCASPHKSDDITPAALFRLIELGVSTLLLDEIDNADLVKNRTFRTIANGGHRRGGRIVRTTDGRPRSFDTFAPMAHRAERQGSALFRRPRHARRGATSQAIHSSHASCLKSAPTSEWLALRQW